MEGQSSPMGAVMTYEIDFDHMPWYVSIRTFGTATVRGFDKLMSALVESPEWIPGTKQLVDHRGLDGMSLNRKDIEFIVLNSKKHGKKLGNGRCAFVVSDALAFALARMYSMLDADAVHSSSNVFYSPDEALAWLTQEP